MPIRLTLDTNLLQEYWREQEKRSVVEQLLDLGRGGVAELVVTARIGDDIPGGPLADRLRELPELGIARIGGIFRLDLSALDGSDMLGSDVFDQLAQQADAELTRRGRAAVPDWRRPLRRVQQFPVWRMQAPKRREGRPAQARPRSRRSPTQARHAPRE
jgi:hypothetical protein